MCLLSGEHTNAFIRCLRQSGGTQITRPAHLRDYPSRDVQDGDGAAFETLAYESIDVALPHHRRQELVLVEYPGDESDWPATPGDLRQARHGHISGERALVLMPPTTKRISTLTSSDARGEPTPIKSTSTVLHPHDALAIRYVQAAQDARARAGVAGHLLLLRSRFPRATSVWSASSRCSHSAR
jgi:hypothetical protein